MDINYLCTGGLCGLSPDSIFGELEINLRFASHGEWK